VNSNWQTTLALLLLPAMAPLAGPDAVPLPVDAGAGVHTACDFQAVAQSETCRQAEGCFFLSEAVRVSVCARSQGSGLYANEAIEAGTSVLVEQAALPKVPAYLHPRCPAEAPPFVWGFPLLIVPTGLLERCPALMRSLRFALNAYGRLYALGSVVNHSCCPNCERIMKVDGLSAFVTTVEVAAGEEITVSYSDSLGSPTWLRRLLLFHRFGFWCSCARCKGDEDREGALAVHLSACADDAVFRRNGMALNKMAKSLQYSPQTSRQHWQHAVPCIMPLLALHGSFIVLGGLVLRKARLHYLAQSARLV